MEVTSCIKLTPFSTFYIYSVLRKERKRLAEANYKIKDAKVTSMGNHFAKCTVDRTWHNDETDQDITEQYTCIDCGLFNWYTYWEITYTLDMSDNK